MDLKELEGLGSRPIREDAPAGASVRSEPEFEALQLELRKLELPAGIQPDWARVAAEAAAITRDRSKDLLVLAWLAVALGQVHGAAGFQTGLTIVRDAATTFWDGLFPEMRRMRGRVAAMDWLRERGSRVVERLDLRPEFAEPLERCLETVEAIDTFFREKVEEGWGGMGELRAALNEIRSRLPASPGAGQASGGDGAGEGGGNSAGDRTGGQDSASSAPSGSAASAGGAGTTARGAGSTAGGPGAAGGSAVALPTVAPSSPAEAQRFFDQVRDAGYRAAEYLRTADPRSPIPYRLARALAWAHLQQIPPHAAGRTQIPPPQPADFALKLQEALAQGQSAGVLEQTEGRFRTSVLWLDLHRYAFEALEALGASEAAEAIAVETAGLLRRLRGLEQLRFANDMPLADAATRAWIAQRVGPSGDGSAGSGADGPAGASGGSEGGSDPDLEGFGGVVEEARNLARRKQLPEALRMLEARASACRRLRARALWRLELGKLCLAGNQPATAYAILHALDTELAEHGPEAWDLELGLDLVKSLFLSHRAALSSQGSPTVEERAVSQALWGRLCRVDPASAIALEGRR